MPERVDYKISRRHSVCSIQSMDTSKGSGKKSKFELPLKINVEELGESRAPELEALHSTISNRLNNDYRSQRSKRRRTSAYKNQASIGRQRKKQKSESLVHSLQVPVDQEEKVSRRARRRSEFKNSPEFGFSTSGDGTKRLRTHVWHAKRFTMTKLWGFYLPLGLFGKGKGSRSLLKHSKNGVLVHDASYHTAVQLEGPEESLLTILEMVLEPSPLSHSSDVLSGVTYESAMLHHAGAPLSQTIAPVTYMWRPSPILKKEDDSHNSLGLNEPHKNETPCFRRLWLWIHASAFIEGYEALKLACQKQLDERGILVNCLSLEGQLAKLEVSGPKALQLLYKTLSPATRNSDNPSWLKKCSSIEVGNNLNFEKLPVLENEEYTSSSAVISLTVKDPRTLLVKRPVDVTSTLENEAEIKANEHANLQGIVEDNKEINSSSSCSKLEDGINLWDASSRLIPPEDEHVLCMEKHKSRMDSFYLDDSKSEIPKTLNKLQASRSCPIMLLKHDKQKISLEGWTVILPLNWDKVFWNAFVSNGAHAIGQREKHWISCDIGLPYFPLDFPDCSAYKSYMVTEAAVRDQQAEKLPPPVRPSRVPNSPPWDCIQVTLDNLSTVVQDTQVPMENNMTRSSFYDNSSHMIVARTSTVLTTVLDDFNEKNLLLFPQDPDGNTSVSQALENENLLSHGKKRLTNYRKLCLVRVCLHAFKEGAFEEGAVVCAPLLSDILLWTSSAVCDGSGLKIPDSSMRSYFKENSSGKWELNVPEDSTSKELHRWPIGFVTTGFVRGSKKPTAEALCDAVLLASLREEQWTKMKRRKKEIYVLVRNLRSTAYRLALATIVLEQQQDVDFV